MFFYDSIFTNFGNYLRYVPKRVDGNLRIKSTENGVFIMAFKK